LIALESSSTHAHTAKGIVAHNYYIYLSDKGISYADVSNWEDLPLCSTYVEALKPWILAERHRLRWLNALSVHMYPQYIDSIRRLTFVDTVVEIGSVSDMTKSSIPSTNYSSLFGNPKWDSLLKQQRNLMQLDLLKQDNLSGKGVTIAVLDAGFKSTDTHPAFRHLHEHERIKATWDFYREEEDVYHHSDHGTQVLGVIAGKYEEQPLGAAPDANILLARTEHVLWENAQEEDHWIAALEWAYRNGANIVCSSLSFTYKAYTFADMDGATAPVSRAAAQAAKKGMLIVVSMGNEGDRKRKYLGAPADVPEVLSVGGSMPMIPMHIRFSSVGPNALNQVKPNVAAPSYVLTAQKRNQYGIKAGTSFGCPLVAGLAACLLQRDPQTSPKALIGQLEKMGHYYPYYDYFLGYGVPQVSNIARDEEKKSTPTFQLQRSADTIKLAIDPSMVLADTLTGHPGRVIYYQMIDSTGNLSWAFYDLLPPNAKNYGFIMPSSQGKLRIWFEGYLFEKRYRNE